MNNRSIIILAFFVAAGFYISCGGNESVEPAVPVTETSTGEHENPDEATLTADQLKTIGIEFGKIAE